MCSIYGNYDLWCTFFLKRDVLLEKFYYPIQNLIHYWQSSVTIAILYGKVSFVKQLFQSRFIRDLIFTGREFSYVNEKYRQAIRTVLIHHRDLDWHWVDPFQLYANIADIEKDAALDRQNDRILSCTNVNLWMHELLDKYMACLKKDRPRSLNKFVRFVYKDRRFIMDKKVCIKLLHYEDIWVDIEEETMLTKDNIDLWKGSTF